MIFIPPLWMVLCELKGWLVVAIALCVCGVCVCVYAHACEHACACMHLSSQIKCSVLA